MNEFEEDDQIRGLPKFSERPDIAPLKIWFSRVHSNIGEIQSAIDDKTGFFIFKTHTYSKDELRGHPNFRRVEVLVENIGENIRLWDEAGKLTRKEKSIYFKERMRVEKSLGELRKNIASRKQTFLEAITDFVRRIMTYLPELAAVGLNWLGQRFLGIPGLGNFLRLTDQRSINKEIDDVWKD